MEDAIVSARSELAKIKPTDPLSVEAVKKADVSLDEGSKALATWQKHIKIANHSDLSWATLNHYMADPLADGPEDEKEIGLRTRLVRTWSEPRRRRRRVEADEEGAIYPPRFRPYADPPPESGRQERYYQPPAMVPQRPSRP